MTPKNITTEILFFTETRFSKKEFCERGEKKESQLSCSDTEQLEKACWAGMLFEMLPEIAGDAHQQKENFIWSVMPAHHFIRVCLGSTPAMLGSENRIDPYFFLLATSFN